MRHIKKETDMDHKRSVCLYLEFSIGVLGVVIVISCMSVSHFQEGFQSKEMLDAVRQKQGGSASCEPMRLSFNQRQFGFEVFDPQDYLEQIFR